MSAPSRMNRGGNREGEEEMLKHPRKPLDWTKVVALVAALIRLVNEILLYLAT